MYAIVDIAGKQFKVEKDRFYYTPLLNGKDGDKVELDQVLLLDDSGKVKVGTPVVKGSKVTGKILEHVKGDKVVVFKKKRRKGYKVRNGHRQDFTKLLIEDISENGSGKSSAQKSTSAAKSKSPASKEKE